MKAVILFLKGMVIGVANVIPGVSTATFMVLLHIYEEVVDAVGNVISDLLADRKRIKTYLLILVPFGIGAAVGTLAFAKLATFVLEQYAVLAQLFFIGLIVGSIPSVARMHHDMKPSIGRVIACGVGFVLAVLVGLGVRSEKLCQLAADPSSTPGLLYFGVVGFFAGGAVMTPGLSGSYIFLLAGTYEPIMGALNSLTHPPIMWGVVVATAVGVSLGIVIFAKLISLLRKRQPAVMFYAILGLICGSLIGLWPAAFDPAAHALAGAPILIAGFVIAYLLGRSTKKEATASQVESTTAQEERPAPQGEEEAA